MLLEILFFVLFLIFFFSLRMNSFPLTQSGNYRIPEEPMRANCIDYISTFPLSPHPEVFGLHENADINRNNKETSAVSE